MAVGRAFSRTKNVLNQKWNIFSWNKRIVISAHYSERPKPFFLSISSTGRWAIVIRASHKFKTHEVVVKKGLSKESIVMWGNICMRQNTPLECKG